MPIDKCIASAAGGTNQRLKLGCAVMYSLDKNNRTAFVDMAALKLGQPRPTIEIAAPNVELTWNTDADWVTRAKYYGSQMLDKKQIRALPDYAKFINTSFVTELAKTK